MNAILTASSIVATHVDHHGHWWLPFGLFWLVALGLLTWFVVRTTRRHERTGVDRAADILAERYARGELTHDEYRERLGHLR
jgi:putative membrane protein